MILARPALAGLGLLAACAGSPAETGEAPDPFVDDVRSVRVGRGGGFGLGALPDVVQGPPVGAGDRAGSTDVVSLGHRGGIVLAFEDLVAVDGGGPDLIVFENAFEDWIETGRVAASEDGVTWAWWPCDPEDAAGGYPGCAGVHPVFAAPGNGIDPTDPAEAGGDAFDLADIGLTRARFLHVRDTGCNAYTPDVGGFDLDAVALVHAEAR